MYLVSRVSEINPEFLERQGGGIIRRVPYRCAGDVARCHQGLWR
jgi:hypothetical protein